MHWHLSSAVVAFQTTFAIAAANNFASIPDLFIGTGASGNAFPGSAVPFAMAKVGIDVTSTPRQAGYKADNVTVTGISLMHDEGTGGNAAGGYGLFPLFPLTGCNFATCPVGITARSILRAAGKDAASPGYFTSTFVNNIKLEATSTRRAGLIRFTFPPANTINHVVVDLTNDLQRSFHAGSLTITPAGRVILNGTFLQSYGPETYTAFGCYDFIQSPGTSNLVQFGTYSSATSSTSPTISPATQTVDIKSSSSGAQIGALLSFNSSVVTARFGVSFISSAQACKNAEAEIPSWDWVGVQEASRSKWEDVLDRVSVDTIGEDATVVKLLYSSLYRVSLVPANATGENPYWSSSDPFFDALFCSWDTFRTVHPLLSITSPIEWAGIVKTYIDGWRHTGYIPECRSNTKPGYVQGGSDGMPILGDFAVKYGAYGNQLGVPMDDLYQALVDTAENTPPDWYRVGRQNTAWKTFGYIPTDWVDPSGSTGLPTREGSRAFEYAVGDFAVRQAAIALNKPSADIAKYANRSMNFVNHWDSKLTHDGFTGFAQRRYPNGSFAYSPPDACSPIDPVGHSCARGTDNNVGFYESSSWEMSFFAPHSMSTIVKLMGGSTTFINRLDRYFSRGYFQAGNEPSFQIPWAYHYANRPDLSALRIRDVVYKNFNTGKGGIPGNDDSGAMGALLTFHLLGLYPVPSSGQLLIGSPFVSSYTIHNPFFGTNATVTVKNFDKATLSQAPPAGSRLYVQSIIVNGVPHKSVCWIDWGTIVGGGDIAIEVGATVPASGCGTDKDALPESLETGGFPK